MQKFMSIDSMGIYEEKLKKYDHLFNPIPSKVE